MDFGPDDLVEFGIRYMPSLALVVIASLAILLALILLKRILPKFTHRPAFRFLAVLTPVIIWFVCAAPTSKFTTTLTMLNSESSETAERTYDGRFRTEVNTLDSAISLAVNKREAPNVRFYASCLIADMLATNDDAVITKTLARVDNSPIIETEFFGGNRLTQQFYVPGHVQPQLTVREIVEKRLQQFRHPE